MTSWLSLLRRRCGVATDNVVTRTLGANQVTAMTKLVRNRDGSVRFDYGAPVPPTAAAARAKSETTPPAKANPPAPTQNSPRLVLDDSVARGGNQASADMWAGVFAKLNEEPLVPAAPAPANPAEAFWQRARNEPWFVSAEMKSPLGGRKSGGRTVTREPRLEVTVRNGGVDAAERLLTELGLTGRVIEQRAVPHGRGYGDHRRR